MKKILLFTITFLFAINAFAQEGVKWETGTLKEALNKAGSNKKGPKLVFMDCYTTWCGPCKHMANVVFPTKKAGEYFNKNFVNIKIDMEKGEGVEIKNKYNVAAFPTFLILDPAGHEVGRIVGSGELDDFIERVEKAKDTRNSPKFIKETYLENKTIDNAILYIKCLQEAYMNKEIGSFIQEMCSEFKPSEIISYRIWPYIQSSAMENAKVMDYILEHKFIAYQLAGEENVNKLILSNNTKILYSWLQGKSQLTKEQVAEKISSIKLLAKQQDYFYNTVAKVADLYSNGRIEDIVKLYNYNSFLLVNEYEIQPIERLFAGMKEITKEDIENYYKEKTNHYQNMLKGIAGWKDMFINAKNNTK